MAYATVNPYTGEKLKSFPDATEEQVKQAIDDADKAFAAWRTTPFATRAAVLSKAAALLPTPDLVLRLDVATDDTRSVHLHAGTAAGQALLAGAVA